MVKKLKQQSKQGMKMRKKRSKIWGVIAFLAPLPLMAGNEISEFKAGLGKIMGFGAYLAFALCFYFLIMAIVHHKQGGDFGKDIFAVIMCAASGMICGAIFYAFGMSEAAIKPSFTYIITYLSSVC